MSIHDKYLDGSTKYDIAIKRIKSFCAGKRVLCAFSGGKDSQACYHLFFAVLEEDKKTKGIAV